MYFSWLTTDHFHCDLLLLEPQCQIFLKRVIVNLIQHDEVRETLTFDDIHGACHVLV